MYLGLWAAILGSFALSFTGNLYGFAAFSLLCLLQLQVVESYSLHKKLEDQGKTKKGFILHKFHPSSSFVEKVKKLIDPQQKGVLTYHPEVLFVMALALFACSFCIGASQTIIMDGYKYALSGALELTYNIQSSCILAMLLMTALTSAISIGESNFRYSILSQSGSLVLIALMFANLYAVSGSFSEIFMALTFLGIAGVIAYKENANELTPLNFMKKNKYVIASILLLLPLTVYVSGSEIATTQNSRVSKPEKVEFDLTSFSVKTLDFYSPNDEDTYSKISEIHPEKESSIFLINSYRSMKEKKSFINSIIFAAMYVPTEQEDYQGAISLYREVADLHDDIFSETSELEKAESGNGKYAQDLELYTERKQSWSKQRDKTFSLLQLAKQEDFNGFWTLYFEDKGNSVVSYSLAKGTYMLGLGTESFTEKQKEQFKHLDIKDYEYNELVSQILLD